MEQQDLIVIGGGTGGYIVATGAARNGLKVTLIEKQSQLGGAALHLGCIPSKTLLHVAQTAYNLQHAPSMGLNSFLGPNDLSRVNAYINQKIATLAQQEEREAKALYRKLGAKILTGSARFIDKHIIQVANQKLTAKNFVIATGSSPMLPVVRGLDKVGYITSDMIFNLQVIPARLTILGDSAAAIEFAQAFARLGSKVNVITFGDSILPKEDPELVNKLKELLINEGIEFYLSTTVIESYLQKNNKILECMHDSGEKFTIATDEILVVTGRRPNIAGLGLENAAVAYGADGIIVDGKLKTSNKNIYALGDVIRSHYKLTHVTEYQANILLSNLAFNAAAKITQHNFPYVIFTSPEYAHVGITEQQALQQQYPKVQVTRFDFKDLDSALIVNAREGFIKVVTSRGKVIGTTILGLQAGNLIAEWVLAIKLGANIADVANTIHAYPTLAQINKRVAAKHMAKNFVDKVNS